MYGLIIKKHWLEKILTGEKTLEIRSSRTGHTGERIALIKSGSSQIKGFCVIHGVEALTKEKWEKKKADHCVDIPFSELLKRYRTPYAWKLTEITACDNPIPYRHPQGAVIWVRLDHLDLE